MAQRSSQYDSHDDSGDDLFEENGRPHDTVDTLPLSTVRPFQTAPSQATFVTQPTQPWNTPNSRPSAFASANSGKIPSSPLVQVAASSPTQATQARSYPSPGLSIAPMRRGALNGGISAMAPPGTQFRPPTWQQQPTQATTQQTLDFSDDEQRVSDSSDDEEQRRRNDIKPSVFMRNGRPIAPARVEESPQSHPRGLPDLASRFAYSSEGSSPLKRPAADDMASAYGNSHRQKKPRQDGPARAQPAKKEMTLDDIPDYGIRVKMKTILAVLPLYPVGRVYSRLVQHRYNERDTMAALVQEDEAKKERKQPNQDSIDLTISDDELSGPVRPLAKQSTGRSASIASKYSTLNDISSPAPEAQIRPLAKQQLAPSKSIADKYSSAQADDGAKPRKRLVRGTGKASPAPQLPSSPVATPSNAQPRKPRAVVSDDDDDSGVGSEAAEDEQRSLETETKLLSFMNEGPALALQDLSAQSEEIISKVIDGRPYSNLDQIRKVCVETTSTTKTGKQRTIRKAVGDRLVDACMDMWVGYQAVDELVAKCEELGRPIVAEMRGWGFDAFGATSRELDLTGLDAPASTHDSGIGTPSSSTSHEEPDVKSRPKPRKPVLQQPKIMNPQLPLKDYQIAGMNWLALLYSRGLSGILADDMGLGKTCQVIAFLAYLKEQGITHGPHLVVAPGSTLENWIREIKRFCPSLRLEPYYGKHTERPEQQMKINDSINDIDIIVTTYDMAQKPHDAKFLRRLPLAVCIYDEAHKLKNSTSAIYNALMRIPASDMRLLLTGTPLQNNLMELGSMLGFLMPKVFGEREVELSNVFKHRAKVEKVQDQSEAGNTVKSKHDALLSEERVVRARSMLTPFILRRKKHQVLKQLPKKTNIVEYCTLSGSQDQYYKEIESNLTSILRERDQQAEEIRTTGKRHAAQSASEKKDKTNILMDLRKAAIHPLLFRRHYTDAILRRMSAKYKKQNRDKDINEQFVFEDFCAMSDSELNHFCTVTETSFRKDFALKKEPWMDSAKVQSLLKILSQHAADGHRTLIFSQWTQVMNILELVFETASIRFFRLDGQTKMDSRQDMIDLFTAEAEEAPTNAVGEDDGEDDDDDVTILSTRKKKPAAVFMLSTRAGGQGINLTAADRVVIFDSGFNPHDDLQAENRAHRVGQTREVEVVKLVAKGTIEEDILRLGMRKVKLDEMVAGAATEDVDADAEGEASKSEADDIREDQGKSIVEKMLAERLRGETANRTSIDERATNGDESTSPVKPETLPDRTNKDVGKAFMTGLMCAGLDMSAAMAPITLGGGSSAEKKA